MIEVCAAATSFSSGMSIVAQANAKRAAKAATPTTNSVASVPKKSFQEGMKRFHPWRSSRG